MAEQGTLLNLDTKELNAYWVDPTQPLQVPANPLHFAAHKYQLILERLDIQAAKNPAQFNSGNYIAIMEKLEKLWEKINNGESSLAVHDEGNLDDSGDSSAASEMGDRVTAGVGAGVSANNPLAG